MSYRLDDLGRDFRKALSLPPGDAFRRFAGRAVRYARRVRNRHRASRLSDTDLFSSLTVPESSIENLLRRRLDSKPLVSGASTGEEVARRIRTSAPSTLSPIVASARKLFEGTFDLLGSGPVRLGRIPDWHRDFKSGKRWDPEAYSLEIVQTPDRGADIKVPWELSRLQHLPTLGIASLLTGDPSFRELAVDHLSSFLELNPTYRGVNWNCTMDVALRAAEILVAEGYLRGTGSPRFWADLLKALLLHGRFIEDNLEDGPVRGNHFLSDLAGLYLCGLGMPEFAEAAAWKRRALAGLAEEMTRQVTPDGVDYEASLSYHAFVTEMFLFPAFFAAERGERFPDPYLRRLESMVEAVAALIRPDGSLPQIGDNDDGRFLILSQYHRSRRDWRPLLALGSYLFRRGEWLTLAGEAWVEGGWTAGEPFLAWRESCSAGSPAPARSRAFPGAGIYQLAGGSLRMVVDAGEVGQGGNGGHAHNDTLAFDLYGLGEEILPDRGTGAYTPSRAERDRFRSTSAHNTVQIDGEEINPIPEEPFRLVPADHPRVLRWRAGVRFTYLSAEHAGYRRLSDGVIHRRRILFDAARGCFLVEDRFEGRGRHRFVSRFHLAPGWEAGREEGGWSALRSGSPSGIRCRWINPPDGLRCDIEEDHHSPGYGATLPARVIEVSWTGPTPARFRFFLSLSGGGGS